jgi:integrase
MAPSQPTKARSDKGSVQIKVSNDRLQLVFRFGGKRYYLSTGFTDAPTHRKLAEMKARQIELDMVSGNFDPTLDKYRPPSLVSKAEPITPKITPNFDLSELWDRYMAFKRPIVSPNTFSKEFTTAQRCIDRHLPSRSLTDAVKIRDWIVANKPPNAAKRLLILLAACCEWSLKSGFIDKNPFEGMSAEVKLSKSSAKNEEKENDPFSVEERDAVIAAFAANSWYRHYAPFVTFLFRTGCRPSEAVALQWKHVSQDFSTIGFEEAIITHNGGLMRRKGLKTQESRKFPANGTLRALLGEWRSAEANPDDLIFPSPEGKFIDFHNFRNRAWATVLESLPLIRYRKPYQTRHTFITLALDNGMDAKDVARLVGNSPEMIYKHYAGRKRDLVVPEF